MKTYVVITVAVIVVGVSGYWLYTNDKLGPISPPKDPPQTDGQVELPPPPEEIPAQPDTIKILSPEEIPEDIPFNEPKPAFAG